MGKPPVAEEALSYPTVAENYHGNHKHHHAESAGPALKQEGQEIEEDDQHLVLKN